MIFLLTSFEIITRVLVINKDLNILVINKDLNLYIISAHMYLFELIFYIIEKNFSTISLLYKIKMIIKITSMAK